MISFRVFNDYDHGLLKWSNTSHISCRRACNTPRIFCQLLTFMLMMMQSIWRRGESVDDRVWPKDSRATTWPHSLCRPEHSSSSLNLLPLILKFLIFFTRVKMSKRETAAWLDRNLFIFQLDATWGSWSLLSEMLHAKVKSNQNNLSHSHDKLWLLCK